MPIEKGRRNKNYSHTQYGRTQAIHVLKSITLNDGVFDSFTITKGAGKSKSRTKYIVNPDLDIMNYYGDTYEGQSAQSIGIQYLEACHNPI